jgi:hypothetical protein
MRYRSGHMPGTTYQSPPFPTWFPRLRDDVGSLLSSLPSPAFPLLHATTQQTEIERLQYSPPVHSTNRVTRLIALSAHRPRFAPLSPRASRRWCFLRTASRETPMNFANSLPESMSRPQYLRRGAYSSRPLGTSTVCPGRALTAGFKEPLFLANVTRMSNF